MDFDWQKFHDFTKKWDPITHYSVDGQWKSGTRTVAPIARGFESLTGNNRLTKANEHDQRSIDRTIENSLGGAALWFGGSYLADAFGNGGSPVESPSSPSSPSLDFDPNGLPDGSPYANDIPKMPKDGGPWWQKLLGAAGGLGGQSGGGQSNYGQGGGGGLLGSQPPQQKIEPVLLGNPMLIEALMKLVQEQQHEEQGSYV